MNPAGALQRHRVLRYARTNQIRSQQDRIIVEEPLELLLLTGPPGKAATHPLTLTLRTPGNDYALAAGLLLAEGLIQDREDIVKMRYCTEGKSEQHYNRLKIRLRPGLEPDLSTLQRFQISTASCGLCGKIQIEQMQYSLPPSPLKTLRIDSDWLYTLPAALNQAQRLFAHTGAVHGAALFVPNGELNDLQEDVGRHNALDKLIGQALLSGNWPLQQSVLLLSGRVSFELIQKSLQARIPIVAAMGAPSNLAISLAQSQGQTLIGFLSAERFNVYHGAERLRSN